MSTSKKRIDKMGFYIRRERDRGRSELTILIPHTEEIFPALSQPQQGACTYEDQVCLQVNDGQMSEAFWYVTFSVRHS